MCEHMRATKMIEKKHKHVSGDDGTSLAAKHCAFKLSFPTVHEFQKNSVGPMQTVLWQCFGKMTLVDIQTLLFCYSWFWDQNTPGDRFRPLPMGKPVGKRQAMKISARHMASSRPQGTCRDAKRTCIMAGLRAMKAPAVP